MELIIVEAHNTKLVTDSIATTLMVDNIQNYSVERGNIVETGYGSTYKNCIVVSSGKIILKVCTCNLIDNCREGRC